MQYFADDFSAMTAGNLSLTAGLIAAGYSELENSGIPSNVAVIAQPSLPAGLQNDLRFPAASTKQVLRFTLSASDIESRLLWSGFPAGAQTVSVSWWEYRAAGNLGGEKFCRVGNFVSGPGSNRGVDSIITLGQVSGTTLIANSANMHDYGDHPLSPGITGWPGLNHFEAVYSLSTGTNSDGSVSLYENGSLIGQASGLQFFNTPSSNAIQLWDIGGWSSTSGGTEGTVTYPIPRYICALRIASSYQGVWLMPGARTMIITGVRTLTQALTPPPLTSAVSGSTATLTWTPPTPTGQSVIAGYRVYKASAVGGPYTQLGGSLPSGQLTFADTLSATSFYQVEAFDQFTTGGRSAGAQCNFTPGGGIILIPGIYPGVGNLSGYNGLTDFTSHANLARSFDVNSRIKGFYVTFSPGQCEGAINDYSAWFTNIQALLNYMVPLGLGLIVNLNISGNVGSTSVPSYMLNNATYGQVVAGTGYKGGQFNGASAGTTGGNVNTVRFDIPATAARIAAMCTALYAQFGTAIYAINPTFSEIEDMVTFVPQMTDNAIIATLCGVGGMFDQIRAGCPKWPIVFSPSFIGSDQFQTMFDCMDRNRLAQMTYDFANGLPVRTGGKAKNIATKEAFLGMQISSNTRIALPGFSDRRAGVVGGGRDFWAHIGPDELGGSTGAHSSDTVPPALVGDGTLQTGLWPEVQLFQCTHVLPYVNQQTGPACNGVNSTGYTLPANYAGGTWGNLMGFFQDKTVPTPTTPSFYS